MRAPAACVMSVLICGWAAGCEAPPAMVEPAVVETGPDLAQLFVRRQATSSAQDAHAVPAHLNSPRAAAQEIATRGRPIDRFAERGVRLHAALYRAAVNADQADHSAYVLSPVDAAMPAAPPTEALSVRDFRLRVLAELTGVARPVAWDRPELTWKFDERAPGGPAALTWFEIVRESPELATLEADVCIESPRTGTRKYRVEAIYDGERWIVRDLGTRTTW